MVVWSRGRCPTCPELAGLRSEHFVVNACPLGPSSAVGCLKRWSKTICFYVCRRCCLLKLTLSVWKKLL